MTVSRAAETDPLSDLKGARYAELQQMYGGLQAQFERGQLSEAELHAAFGVFWRPDPALNEPLNAWVQSYPESYEAYTALGHWLLSRAWAMRGDEPVSRVTDLGWRGTLHFLEQADTCARHAVNLARNPLTAWLLIGRARNLAGCQMTLEDVQEQRYPEWFSRPLAKNPRSLELRQLMLDHLRPEWGGSDEHMFAFVRQQEAGGQLGAGDIHRLWADYHARVSHHALHFLNDLGEGVSRAHLAADMYEPHSEYLFVALTRAVAPDAERQNALERYLHAAEQNPALRPQSTFYWALYNSDRFLEPLLPRVALLLSRWAASGTWAAAVALGRLTLLNRQWQLPDPLPLLRRARDEGSREAAETIVYLQEEGLGLRAALTDSRTKRTDVLHAAELSSPEMCWRVYQNFAPYREQFSLDARQRYRYLLRAADTGHNDARYELAQQLRAGNLEVGEDGVLRPVNTQPLQQSLDYARHLLERAAAEDHPGALQALRTARDTDWKADTARRLRPHNLLDRLGNWRKKP